MTVLATAFDPYDYAFQADPYPTYASLRRQAPLHHEPEHGFWVLSRHEDVAAAFRDEATFSNAMGVSLDPAAWSPDAHRTMSFLAMDPPRQTRLRSLVSRGFTPRRVAELEPSIQRLSRGHLDRALEHGDFDWIEAFAGRFPMDVISELMGVPEQDRDGVRRLADLTVHREEGIRDVPPRGMEAALELIGYYTELLEERRRRPADDLTSALLEAEIDGDRLTEEEIVGFLFLMVVAGNETTTKLLGNALYWLTRHPEQLRRVLDDPDLVEAWIEETLRYDTPTQILARHLKRDLHLHGRTAPEGSQLLLLLGSANRDGAVFERPDVFDIDRPSKELARSVSFGGGRHFCLGANLARMEARVALRQLVGRVRTLEVDHDAAERVHSVNVRGFSALPVRVEVAA
jgi:cytochrome P450